MKQTAAHIIGSLIIGGFFVASIGTVGVAGIVTGSQSDSQSFAHSVVIGSYPGSLCESKSQAINDPEDCKPLAPLAGLKSIDSTHAPIITHTVPLLYGFGVSAE